MANLISSAGTRRSHFSGISQTSHNSTNNSNIGIANGKQFTIKVGYDGFVIKRSKSSGKSGNKVATKNFGRERRDD